MCGARILLAALLVFASVARAQDPYNLIGCITAIQHSGAFDIEGIHILFTPTTKFRTRTSSFSTAPASRPATYYLGESIEAVGVLDNFSHTLTASRITLVPAKPASVRGIAIIDLIPSVAATQPASARTIRADGFLLHITAKTKLNFAAPLTSIADIATNQWVDYSGVQQLDGTVLLDYAGIGPNKVSHMEDWIRTKVDYDPAAVPDGSHQSGVSKAFIGVDPRKIPPYRDAAMQARVQRIGESLIPAYQRALPASDPNKINFRFQVIDSTKWRDAASLSNGIILVPRQVVERMQNDDQLAAVLADNIAETIEKDTLHITSTYTKVVGAEVAGDVAGIFLPGAGLATLFAGGKVSAHGYTLELQQSGRVSLCFLHDAGYDITQAPLAWWLLASKSVKPIEQVPIPPRADTLYIVLGTTWNPIAEASRLP